MANTQRPAAHLKIRQQAELVELLHAREEARLRFHDLNDKILERLNSVPSAVQETFGSLEKLYRTRLPDPTEDSPTAIDSRSLERLDQLEKAENPKDKKSKKKKSPAQKLKSRLRLQTLKEQRLRKKFSEEELEERRRKKQEDSSIELLGDLEEAEEVRAPKPLGSPEKDESSPEKEKKHKRKRARTLKKTEETL